jgi:hypothetical protein
VLVLIMMVVAMMTKTYLARRWHPLRLEYHLIYCLPVHDTHRDRPNVAISRRAPRNRIELKKPMVKVRVKSRCEGEGENVGLGMGSKKVAGHPVACSWLTLTARAAPTLAIS